MFTEADMLKKLALTVLCIIALQFSVRAASDAPQYQPPKRILPKFLTQEIPVDVHSFDTDDFFDTLQSREFIQDRLVVIHLHLSQKATKDLWLTEEDLAPFIGRVKAIIVTNNAEPLLQIYYKSNTSGRHDCELCGMRIPRLVQENRDAPEQHICVLFWPAGAGGIERLLKHCNVSLDALNLDTSKIKTELSETEIEPESTPGPDASTSGYFTTLRKYGSYALQGAWSAAAVIQTRFSTRSSTGSSAPSETSASPFGEGHADDSQELSDDLIDKIFADDDPNETTT
jgi:hypothetical protein